MRILLFGRDGQLGRELEHCLRRLGEVTLSDQADFDLTKTSKIPVFIEKIQPDVIVNAAAFTDVDAAESQDDLAYTINAIVPGVLAEEAHKRSSLLIHYSTDYVFDGQSSDPYTELDPPHPINVYGKTKLNGEIAVQNVGGSYLIFRTSWLYNMSSNSFPTKVLNWAREQKEMHIVSDQIGSPTWSRSLAELTTSFLDRYDADRSEWLTDRFGIYHVAGKGQVSRYEWAKRVLEFDPDPEFQIVKDVQPACTEMFPTQANRPLYTVLDCSKFENAFNLTIPSWEQSLRTAMLEGLHDR
jgi:dTDP-4-dehydrorhamnose reductase